ncbi:hypothetical protein SeMB42_g05487 [Synchytrium endobioticum]|uniref:Uncharacterized protein n=1 Tax=Synchytrium endobioticum TaxID=286115 RepID=A0A507CWK1_9FUNG|nr:hypothetical protein SeMB42_g05487 [Synchytrium endobioticum]TPX43536.1 hypothetical protein SeLEV6574_g05009 [Synchytrium endobioticum]
MDYRTPSKTASSSSGSSSSSSTSSGKSPSLQVLVARFRNDPPRPPQERKSAHPPQRHSAPGCMKTTAAASASAMARSAQARVRKSAVATSTVVPPDSPGRLNPRHSRNSSAPPEFDMTSSVSLCSPSSSILSNYDMDSPDDCSYCEKDNNESLDPASVLQSFRIKYSVDKMDNTKEEEGALNQRANIVLQKWSHLLSSWPTWATNSTTNQDTVPLPEVNAKLELDPDTVIDNIRKKYGIVTLEESAFSSNRPLIQQNDDVEVWESPPRPAPDFSRYTVYSATRSPGNSSVLSTTPEMPSPPRPLFCPVQAEPRQSKMPASTESKAECVHEVEEVVARFVYEAKSRKDAAQVREYLKSREVDYGGKLFEADILYR